MLRLDMIHLISWLKWELTGFASLAPVIGPSFGLGGGLGGELFWADQSYVTTSHDDEKIEGNIEKGGRKPRRKQRQEMTVKPHAHWLASIYI